jgi:nitrogen-specific signal transduction histidine kinase
MHEDQLYTIGYSTKENGSGLGIPIAKAIIEKHEGSLDIQCLRDMFMVTIALPVHEETKRPTSQKSCLIFGF